MIKYKTRWEEIEKVEIIRESGSSVWNIENRRSNKRGDWENYFDTFSEAKNFLIERENEKIRNLEDSIEYHREKIQKINLIEEI